jgi:flagellar biosynthesis/type III secretory pathway M-ring protein FliF/YscJ
MDTWIYIVIGIAAVLLVALVLTTLMRGRLADKRRAEAHKLRQEAQNRAVRAQERESVAEDIAAQAREERERSASLHERADRLDPDRNEVRKAS